MRDESRDDRDPEQRLAEEASREDRDPEQAGRVEWTATVNMATDDPRRGAREMSAVANYAPDLKAPVRNRSWVAEAAGEAGSALHAELG